MTPYDVSASSWTWKAGPYLMEHRVEPRGEGCDVVIEVTAAGPLEAALRATYGPLIAFLLGRLAKRAEVAGTPSASR